MKGFHAGSASPCRIGKVYALNLLPTAASLSDPIRQVPSELVATKNQKVNIRSSRNPLAAPHRHHRLHPRRQPQEAKLVERTGIRDLMRALKLYCMRRAYDEIMGRVVSLACRLMMNGPVERIKH
jgi:hypothetical protein